jgi:hypothetical protein
MADDVEEQGKSAGSELWELVRESVIFQGLLVVVVSVTVCGLVFMGREVPDRLWDGFLVIVTFFFGQKPVIQMQRMVKTLAVEIATVMKDGGGGRSSV